MGVKITWTNQNTGEDGTRIYRSLTPIDELDLPEPVGEVGPGITEFNDLTAEANKVYYYRFGVFKGNDEVLSVNESVYTGTYRGPGPSELTTGNYHNFGYFGSIPAASFITANQIATQLPTNPGGGNVTITNWYKLFHGGKILFVPNAPLRNNVSWKAIYEAGAVFGKSGDCFDEISDLVRSSLTPTDQRPTISFNGHVFIPRLFSGLKPGQEFPTDNSISFDSELGKIGSLISHEIRTNDANGRDLRHRTLPLSGSHATWVKETHSNAGVYKLAGSPAATLSSAHTSTSSGMSWLPVLELVISV